MRNPENRSQTARYIASQAVMETLEEHYGHHDKPKEKDRQRKFRDLADLKDIA